MGLVVNVEIEFAPEDFSDKVPDVVAAEVAENPVDRETGTFDDSVGGPDLGDAPNQDTEKRVLVAETNVKTFPGPRLVGPVTELVKVEPVGGALLLGSVGVRVGVCLGEQVELDFDQPELGS